MFLIKIKDKFYNIDKDYNSIVDLIEEGWTIDNVKVSKRMMTKYKYIDFSLNGVNFNLYLLKNIVDDIRLFGNTDLIIAFCLVKGKISLRDIATGVFDDVYSQYQLKKGVVTKRGAGRLLFNLTHKKADPKMKRYIDFEKYYIDNVKSFKGFYPTNKGVLIKNKKRLFLF
ncbi:hypothetical protein [Peptostreptococcus faecalis]|uniref:hypothetical protein n=1 Tax=Peptostreptococcus faecalis TaxID=2045015 RepID=UPI000C7E291D|nr:hypothetical protein [Peptostreptococcus faecalis]